MGCRFWVVMLVALPVLMRGISCGATGAEASKGDFAEVSRLLMPFSFESSLQMTLAGGSLLQIEQPSYPGRPAVRVLTGEGAELLSTTFTLPEATGVFILGFARAVGGTVAVCGNALAGDGRLSTFASWISGDGRQQQVLKLSPFMPWACAIASGGVLWVAGAEVEKVEAGRINKELKEIPEYDVLRRYDRSGQQLGGAIRRSTVKARPPYQFWPAMDSKMAVSLDRVGWYSDGAGEYIEVSFDGRIITRVSTVPLGRRDDFPITGLAMCESGDVFVSRVPRGPGHEVYRLDRGNSSWKLVYKEAQHAGLLVGCNAANELAVTEQVNRTNVALKLLREAPGGVQ